MSSNTLVRMAVIGAGAMGRNNLRVLNDFVSVEIVGVADADMATAGNAARRLRTASYGDYREMLDHTRPDAVVVAVPTILHREVVLEVIARGMHVLVEKPIAFTVQEGREMIEAARA